MSLGLLPPARRGVVLVVVWRSPCYLGQKAFELCDLLWLTFQLAKDKAHVIGRAPPKCLACYERHRRQNHLRHEKGNVGLGQMSFPCQNGPNTSEVHELSAVRCLRSLPRLFESRPEGGRVTQRIAGVSLGHRQKMGNVQLDGVVAALLGVPLVFCSRIGILSESREERLDEEIGSSGGMVDYTASSRCCSDWNFVYYNIFLMFRQTECG